MKCQNVVYEDSFDYQKNSKNESILDCILKLDKIQTYCEEISEKIYHSDKLYEKEFIEGKLLGVWLYESDDENRDEKEFLSRMMQTWSRDDVTPNENTINICFYKIPGTEKECLAQGKNEWFSVRRSHLNRCEAKDVFIAGLQSCFPNLCFSLTLEASLNSLHGFRNFVSEIVKHLAILNDIALDYFHEHGERGALDRIGIDSGFDCSLEGNSERVRRYLTFDFLTDTGETIKVKCSPHTKLIRPDSNARIYFSWKHEQIGNGTKLLIGRIGTHPY